MTEEFDEAVYAHIRASERYQSVMELLSGMAEDGDQEAIGAVALINSFIPPEKNTPGPPVGKPQEVPPIRQPEVLKKHIKKSGK
jgi:hypothetical protein